MSDFEAKMRRLVSLRGQIFEIIDTLLNKPRFDFERKMRQTIRYGYIVYHRVPSLVMFTKVPLRKDNEEIYSISSSLHMKQFIS